jgi:membrane protease YdiL (CAAX protease family)
MAATQATSTKPMTKVASARQFVLGAVWVWIAFHVSGLFGSFFTVQYAPLVSESVTLALLLAGFAFLSSVFDGEPWPLRTMGLIRRKTAKTEWALGLALGWGMVAVLVLPMMLSGRLHPEFHLDAAAWNALVLNLFVLAVAALAEEVGFRGYVFQRLIEAAGEAWATVLMAVLFGIVHLQNPHATVGSTLSTVLAGVLFSVAYLRTRALWLPWGMHFGWNASMAVLFGLPMSGIGNFASVVETQTDTPRWLTGGLYGPEASVLASVVLLAGLIVLIRTTRDYAWEYNFQPIVGAGYPMDVPPPAEHAKMEGEAKPAPLVQILPTTPAGFSKTDSPGSK